MDTNETLNFAVLAGEIMLSSGAETYRVEDTIRRILISCEYEICEAFVATTGIFASVKEKDGEIITLIKRVHARSNNFERIIVVNEVSRQFTEKKIDIELAIKQIKEIQVKKPYNPIIKIIGAGIASFSFAYMFGGVFSDCVNACLTGAIVQLVTMKLEKNKVSSVLVNILGGVIIALSTLFLLAFGVGKNIDNVIIGAIMPLVPGVALTNAIRDVLVGDYLSGTSRIVDAIIIAVSIATGIGVVLKIWFYFSL